MDAVVFGSKKYNMGLFAKLISYTPFDKYYKEYNYKKWKAANDSLEKKLFPERISFYKQFIKAGDLVFDVGANVGNRTEVFLACQASVVAVEPQPSCVEILKKKFNNSITIEQVGLSDAEGELEMYLASDTTASTFDNNYIKDTKDKFRYTAWNQSIKVQVTTLEKLIARYGVPQFCKIDVEGFEFQVLKGLKSTIPCLSFEYAVPERKQAMLDCMQLLNNLSADGQFNYSIGETMTWALNNWMSYADFKHHVNSPSFDKTLFGDIYFKS